MTTQYTPSIANIHVSHTPGLWLSVPYSSEIEITETNYDGFRKPTVIARIKRFDEVDIANAQLIAAAPELLEALKASVKSLEWTITVIKDIPAESNFMQSLNEARAAIAKAGGAK